MLGLIVAYANNRVIGNKGRIPWRIKGEQQRFKELTTGSIVIMGRRSYEEIGHPLPNRYNIVISTTKNFDGENCITARSLKEALDIAGDRDAYISGGGRLYREALPLCDKLFITEIELDVEGDTFFPAFDERLYKKTVDRRVEGEIPYTYLTYEKIRWTAMTITYPVKNGLYVNLTNQCNCSCTFCLRSNGPGVYGSEPLWLEHEPEAKEVIDDIRRRGLENYDEVVFCGYGEPTKKLDTLLEVAAFIKENSSLPVRLNTNGLADLLWGEPVAPRLAGLIDTVSISLNATNAKDYQRLTRSEYGERSYQAMLDFARDCTRYVPKVVMTVVDKVTTPEEQEKARRICESIGVHLRVRPFEE